MGKISLLRRKAVDVPVAEENYVNVFFDDDTELASFRDEFGNYSVMRGLKGDTGNTGPTGPAVPLSTANPNPLGTANPGDDLDASRADHVHAHGNLGGGALHAIAQAYQSVGTPGVNGFLSARDKQKLDSFHYDIVADGGYDPLTDTDCTPFAQAANDFFGQLGVAAEIFFPCSLGSYRFDGTVNATANNITWRGEQRVGSLIKVNSASADVFKVTGYFNRFEGLRFQGATETIRTGGWAINFNPANVAQPTSLGSSGTVIGCDFLFLWSAIKCSGQLPHLENLNIRIMGANAPGGANVLIDSFVDGYITDMIMDNAVVVSTHAGIRITHLSSLVLTNSQIIHCGLGLDLAPTGTNTIPSIFCNNTYFDQGVIGLNLASAAGTIGRSTFVACWFSGNSSKGVNFASSNIQAVDFLGCQIFGNVVGIDAAPVGTTKLAWQLTSSRVAGNTTAGIRTAAGTGHSLSVVDTFVGACGGFGNNGVAFILGSGTYERVQIDRNRGLELNNTPGLTGVEGVLTTLPWNKKIGDNLGALVAQGTALIADAPFTNTIIAGGGGVTLPANSLPAGSTIEFVITGSVINTTAASNLNIPIRINGVTVATFSVALGVTAFATPGRGFKCNGSLTIRTSGAAGTAMIEANLEVNALTNFVLNQVAPVAINTTVQNVIDAQVSSSAATSTGTVRTGRWRSGIGT